MTEHWAIDIGSRSRARRSADRTENPGRSGRLRVLFVSSEIFPLAKTGGLADVSAALPGALASQGIEPLLLMPGYPCALDTAVNKRVVYELREFSHLGDARIVAGWTPDSGLPVWLFDCPALFDRQGGIYQDEQGRDWPDNALRFGTFCRAVAAMATNWLPDVVHLNDWQTGLAALYLAHAQGPPPSTLFTIHNMAFQGIFPREATAQLDLPESACGADGIEYFGKVSFLKAGLRYADRLTTVSSTYAREILTPEFGFGLQGLLQARQGDLSGVLNGIDDSLWNPQTDPYLPRTFTARDLSGKHMCKAALQRELGLKPNVEVPLVAFASRFTDQKMVDCIPKLVPTLMAEGAQLAVVGEGDRAVEAELAALAHEYPGRVAVRIGHDEGMAHRVHAGADIVLAPARFEPCGLVQMYAMRYGALPVVRAVGGLADTVVDATAANIENGTACGFAFAEASAEAMTACVVRALGMWRQSITWRRLQSRAMAREFGWARSAPNYIELYRALTNIPAETPREEPVQADPAQMLYEPCNPDL